MDQKNEEINLEHGTVKKLQDYVAAKIKQRGFEDETLHERLLLLTEELGELVNACRKISGMNVDQHREIQNKVGEEVADVINMVFAVGIELGLDIEKEFIEKNEKIDKRIYARKSVAK
jgi:NTP pyrophosphatase (non-canonical NTP hydrolase)